MVGRRCSSHFGRRRTFLRRISTLPREVDLCKRLNHPDPVALELQLNAFATAFESGFMISGIRVQVPVFFAHLILEAGNSVVVATAGKAISGQGIT